MDSPVNITDNITVAAGRILNISSGVTVIFQGNYSIKVEGRLNCSGNLSSPVTITGNDTVQNSSGSRIELASGGKLYVDRLIIENITGFIWRGTGTLANSSFVNCSVPVDFVNVSTDPYSLLNTSFRNSSIADISLNHSNISILDCFRQNKTGLLRRFIDNSSRLREWVSFSIRTFEDTNEALEGCHLKVENSSHTAYSSSHFLGSDPVTGPDGATNKIEMLSNFSASGGWKNETVNISVYIETNEGEWNESGIAYSLDSLMPGATLDIVANVDIFPPDPPQNLLIEQLNNSTVNISWTSGNSPDISGHLVYYNESGNWIEVANVSTPVNYTHYTPVEVGNNSSFKVRSYDNEFLASTFTPERWIMVTDVEAPQILSSEPAGSNVSVNTIIIIRFSEPMDTVSVQSSFRFAPSSGLSMYFTDDNKTFNVKPFLPLNPFTVYTVNISIDATDASGNNLTENYSFNFTTAPDTTAPRVLSVRATHVKPGEEKVFLISNFEISFSESLNENSFVGGFSIFPSVEGSVISSEQRRVFRFDPDHDLDFDTTYYITLYSNITDIAGNPMLSNHYANFTTVSEPLVVIPEVLDYGPLGMETSIRTEIYINFSEAMNLSRIIGALSISPEVFFEYNHSADNKNFSFKPTVLLKGSTFYNVTLSQNAKSLAGFSILKALNFNFTTHETDKPMVIKTMPEANERDVPVRTDIVFWFDEAVFEIDAIPASFFPLVNFSWMINRTDNSLVINVTGKLEYGQEYRVGVTGLVDVFGNSMNYEWLTFWTVAELKKDSPPAVYKTWPENGSENTPLDTLIWVTFHEAIRDGRVDENSIIVRYNNITGVAGTVSYDGEYLSIDLSSPLKPNSSYTVTVFGVLSVADGIPMEKPFHFTFTTHEMEITMIPTTVLDSFPSNGTRIDYDKDNVTIWFMFSAPMDVGSFEGNISIIPPIHFTLVPENNDKRLVIKFTEDLLPGIKYSITIEPQVLDANGTALGKVFDKIFYTRYELNETTEEKENWFADNYPAVAVITILLILIILVYIRPKKSAKFAGELPCPRCARPVLKDDRVCWSCKLRLDGEPEEDGVEEKKTKEKKKDKDEEEEKEEGTEEKKKEEGREEKGEDSGKEKVKEDEDGGTGKDYHAILGVASDATEKEIKAAFKKLAEKYHPDKVRHMGKGIIDVAAMNMRELNEARDALMERLKEGPEPDGEDEVQLSAKEEATSLPVQEIVAEDRLLGQGESQPEDEAVDESRETKELIEEVEENDDDTSDDEEEEVVALVELDEMDEDEEEVALVELVKGED